MAETSKKSSTNRPVASALANPYPSQAAGWVPDAVIHQAALIQDQLKTDGAPAAAFRVAESPRHRFSNGNGLASIAKAEGRKPAEICS
jgi:hypothetical protein